MFKGIFAIIFLNICIKNAAAAFMKNSYSIALESVQVCPDNDKNDAPLRNLKFRRYNRTHQALSFDVTFPYALDKNVGAEIAVEKFVEGRWKKIPFLPFQPNACQTFLYFFHDYAVSYMRAMGVKEPDKCPLPPGSYSMKDFTVDLGLVSNLKNVPFWTGRFQVFAMTKRQDNGHVMYCYLYTINVAENY